MPRPSVWLVRAALIFLAAGVTAGALMLAGRGLGIAGRLAWLLPFHAEFLLMGWTVQLCWGSRIGSCPPLRPAPSAVAPRSLGQHSAPSTRAYCSRRWPGQSERRRSCCSPVGCWRRWPPPRWSSRHCHASGDPGRRHAARAERARRGGARPSPGTLLAGARALIRDSRAGLPWQAGASLRFGVWSPDPTVSVWCWRRRPLGMPPVVGCAPHPGSSHFRASFPPHGVWTSRDRGFLHGRRSPHAVRQEAGGLLIEPEQA